MTRPISEIIIYTIFVSSIFGTVFGAVFYIPDRIEKPKRILRQLKYLSGRSGNNGCITVFDLATEAEISPKEAKKALDKYIQEL